MVNLWSDEGVADFRAPRMTTLLDEGVGAYRGASSLEQSARSRGLWRRVPWLVTLSLCLVSVSLMSTVVGLELARPGPPVLEEELS